MDAETLFAQSVSTPEATIDRVRRDLLVEWAGLGPPPREITQAAEASVRALWDSKVKLFVPVLALRAARSSLGNTPLRWTPARLAPLPVPDPALTTALDPQCEALDVTDDSLDVAGDSLDLSSDMRV
ncbi:MAG: hypothetical protein M3Q03_15715 [Chloroflexota bacterium]|nr:hypothetical protein [Chloroflexota bacterium]